MAGEMMTLSASTREFGNKGAARRTRRAGLIPGVVYGGGRPGTPVAVDPKEIEETLSTVYGFNVVFTIALEGGDERQVMVRDYQFDSVRRELTHIDFVEVSDEDYVAVDVVVKTEGKSKGVVMGGRLDIARRSVKVRCMSKDIPTAIVHDITDMAIGESAYIDEIEAPEGVEFVYDHRFPVLRIARKRGAKSEDEETDAAAPADGEEAAAEEGEE